MTTTAQDLQNFTEFVQQRLSSGEELSLEELFDLWLIENPPAHIHEENVAAVNAAIRDFKSGDRGTLAPANSDQLRREYFVAD